MDDDLMSKHGVVQDDLVDEAEVNAAMARRRILGGSLMRWLIVGAMLVALGLGYMWWSQRPERFLGDKGRVVAVVTAECGAMVVDKDDLHFSTHAVTPSAYSTDASALQSSGTIPDAWAGTSVPGRLEVIEARADNDMLGQFSADDGTVITLLGGATSELKFDTLACAIDGS